MTDFISFFINVILALKGVSKTEFRISACYNFNV